MKHLTILPILALLLSTLHITSCSSEEDDVIETENGGVIVTPTFLSPDDISETSYFADSICWIEFNEDGTQTCFVPIVMLDSAEFSERLKQVNLIDLPLKESRNAEGVIIRPEGSFTNIELSLRGFHVRYLTPYVYQFPLDIHVYRVSYERAKGEYYGSSYGHIHSDSEMYVCLDITHKTANKEYEYAYTVGLKALIRDRKFHLTPLEDL